MKHKMRTAQVIAFGLVGAGFLTGTACNEAQQAAAATTDQTTSELHLGSAGRHGNQLPVDQIEATVGAQGTVTNGVLDISISRDDIGAVQGPRDVTFTPAFEIHGDLYFQPLGHGHALLNGNLALKEEETNPFISALLKNNLVFQAFHQHLPMHPQVWFVHFRGESDPITLAKEIRAAMSVTNTPLPQPPPPQNPSTPLDPDKLASILHGTAEVGEEGVVTVTVDRTNLEILDGVRVSPEAGISTTIEFKPLDGSQAAVVPDFSMTSHEVVPVVDLMLNTLGWYQGCLYNQETDEHPQLYFDHMLKTGDAYELAQEIRQGLDLTAAQ